MMRRAMATALLAALSVGCSGGGSDAETERSEQPSESGSPSTASEPPAAEESPTMVEPNVGERALDLGDTREGLGGTTQVLEIARPMPDSNEFRTPDANGHEYVGLNVRSCARSSESAGLSVGWHMWSIQDVNGGTYPASSSSWDDFPSPQFPVAATVPAGDCVAGWLLVSVASDVDLDKAYFSDDSTGTRIAEWRLDG